MFLSQGAHACADRKDFMASEYTIRDLASEFEVTTRTIRFYEDQGLLMPERRGQHRIFSLRDRIRLRLILRGKRLGFSLAEIREIIDMYDEQPGEVGQLEHFLEKLEMRRADLQEKLNDIEMTLSELDAVEAVCRQRLTDMKKGKAAE
ncbi:MerR family transcriptional regulator [Aestuariispira insulae]|uniref:MerR family transcriptional regulator n=2 Tax=Aestuariispira insulae TaxID=1461337 RepID=A0A3D9HSS3_9PROT|nr:MerR family transcriptional regulator [Aestuariispira insulae]